MARASKKTPSFNPFIQPYMEIFEKYVEAVRKAYDTKTKVSPDDFIPFVYGKLAFETYVAVLKAAFLVPEDQISDFNKKLALMDSTLIVHCDGNLPNHDLDVPKLKEAIHRFYSGRSTRTRKDTDVAHCLQILDSYFKAYTGESIDLSKEDLTGPRDIETLISEIRTSGTSPYDQA